MKKHLLYMGVYYLFHFIVPIAFIYILTLALVHIGMSLGGSDGDAGNYLIFFVFFVIFLEILLLKQIKKSRGIHFVLGCLISVLSFFLFHELLF